MNLKLFNFQLKENGKITSYIVLEDILKDFKLPCVMDLKIGKQVYSYYYYHYNY